VSRGPSAPAVSAIVVNYEAGDALLECLASLGEQGLPMELVLVDNGSRDGSAARACAEFPEARLVRPGRNLGFAAGANLGAADARAPILLFLNPDVKLAASCLASLAGALRDERTGVAGPVLEVSSSGTREYGGTIDPFGYPIALHQTGRALYVPGCALATPAELFRRLGGFDERFFMFAEDVDYCWRSLLAGRDVKVVPDALAFHVGGGSTPGGYLGRDGLSTTRFRVALRERNTLAMLLKCHRPAAATAIALAYPVQALATAVALAAAGKRSTAGAILSGLAWNVRELPGTLARRRAARIGSRPTDAAVRARMHYGVRKLELLVRHGLPRVDDSSTPTPAAR
jgi:GT2 family glycosyltransferase